MSGKGSLKRPRSQIGGGEESLSKASGKATADSSSFFVQLQTLDGVPTGGAVEVPGTTTPAYLESFVNYALGNDEIMPYGFFIGGDQMGNTLGQSAKSKGLTSESTVAVLYQPLSLYRVRPVTRCTDTMTGHTAPVLHVSFSPDGSVLASGGGDGLVRFWDAFMSMPKHKCEGHKSHVLCTAFSPDGKLFASGDYSGVARVWHPGTGKEACRPLVGHKAWITSMAWEPVSEARGGTCRRLATASKDGSVRVWDASRGTFLFSLAGHKDSVECVRWGLTGLLYTCSRDRTIKCWRVPKDGEGGKGVLVAELAGHGHRVNALALSTDYVARTGALHFGKPSELPKGEVKPPTAKGNKGEEKEGDGAAAPSASSASSSSSSSASSSSGPSTAAASGAGADYPKAASGTSAGSSPAKRPRTEAAGGKGEGGGDPLALQAIARERAREALRQGGERVVSCSDDYTLMLWEPGKALALASGGGSGVTSVRPKQRMSGHQAAVNHISFSPDGRFVASASFDKKVRVWDGHSGKFLVTLHGHVGPVYQVCWSPDSRFLVSASKDSTAKLWVAGKESRGKAAGTLAGHFDEVYALDWSPAGDRVATGSKDRTLKMWRN